MPPQCLALDIGYNILLEVFDIFDKFITNFFCILDLKFIVSSTILRHSALFQKYYFKLRLTLNEVCNYFSQCRDKRVHCTTCD